MRYWRVAILGCVFAFSIFLTGCEKNGVTDGVRDSNLARDRVSQANAAFEGALFSLIATDFAGVTRPSDINFKPANSLYKEAFGLDPNNLDANFGAALTEILIFTSDATVNATWDRWEAYIDTASIPFEVPGTVIAGTFGIPRTGFPTKLKAAKALPIAYPSIALGMAKLSTQNPPQISELQDLLINQMLPKVEYALARLATVTTNPNYRFTVTPKMQGDVLEDALELDLTEIYAFEAILNLARSFALVATAYSFDVATYDSTGMFDALERGSNFLALRTDGLSQMSDARDAIMSATERLDDAVNFLKSETDDQNNDIIKRKPEDFSDADLDSLLAYDERVRSYLTYQQSITEDFDGNPGTADATVDFDLKKFFTNPIQDLKGVLPSYTIEIERDTTYWEEYTSGNVPVVATYNHTGQSGEFNYYQNCWWNEWSGLNCYQIGLTIPEFAAVVDSINASLRARTDVTWFDIWVDWYGTLYPGANSLSAWVYYGYHHDVQDRIFYAPVIVWTADSFSEWVFPYPTFNGFLPEMTDPEFKQVFGITAADWQKRNRPFH